jgi:hypothetical protein
MGRYNDRRLEVMKFRSKRQMAKMLEEKGAGHQTQAMNVIQSIYKEGDGFLRSKSEKLHVE